jgi:hypothetical protein
MTLSLQEISDRLELQDLVFRYSEIVDRKAFEELREIFTEEAHVDYSGTGGAVGNLEETIGFLHGALGMFSNHQHLVSNTQFTIDGDKATGKVMCLNPMEMKVEEGTHTFLLGLWYLDEFVRTADGWRFTARSQKASWNLNLPPQMTGQ